MGEPLKKKHQRMLALVDQYKQNEDWEKGTPETFAAILLRAAEELPSTIGGKFFDKLTRDIERSHRREGGMWQDFHDIAYQEWLADFLVITIRNTLTIGLGTLPTSLASRTAVIVQIDTLLLALQENIDAATQRRNSAPMFDLALHGDEVFVAEIRRLTQALEGLRNVMTKPSASKQPRKVSLAAEVLREFVLKLSGTLGEGMGKTVTWGARIALAWFAIGILKDLGIPVDGLIQALQQNILPR